MGAEYKVKGPVPFCGAADFCNTLDWQLRPADWSGKVDGLKGLKL